MTDDQYGKIYRMGINNRIMSLASIGFCFLSFLIIFMFNPPVAVYSGEEVTRKQKEIDACKRVVSAQKELISGLEEKVGLLIKKDSILNRNTNVVDSLNLDVKRWKNSSESFEKQYKLSNKSLDNLPSFHHKKQKQ